MARKILRIFLRFVLTLCAIILLLQGLTPVYDFREPAPFTGDSIYNPYNDVDFSTPFLKGNFHAHASNEGAPFENMHIYEKGEFGRLYTEAGYAVPLITDHQYINPESPIRAYEHGYNLNNYHVNSFNAKEVWGLDIPLMLRPTSQMQWQINNLRNKCELVSINHPSRLRMGHKPSDLELLTGYHLMEVDNRGGNAPLDIVLSSGYYPMILATDDSHFPDSISRTFQNRYTMVSLPDDFETKDVLKAIKNGHSYGVQLKVGTSPRGIGTEPQLREVSMSGDTLRVAIAAKTDSILFIGQGGKVKDRVVAADSTAYVFTEDDTYIRAEIFLNNGMLIWLNPVARNSARGTVALPTINWLLTILNSILWFALSYILIRITFKKRKRSRKCMVYSDFR